MNESNKKNLPRNRTHQVLVGNVALGGGAPPSVQSMLNAPADDAGANLAQIDALAEAGCEIVRMAIPARESLDTFEEVCAKSSLPVVADVHFDPEIAIGATCLGAAKLRINPGNIGGLLACDLIIEVAKSAGIPIRIGVNAGSLDASITSRDDLTLAEKLCESAVQYVKYFERHEFHDLVVSAKAHDVSETIEVNRLLAQRLPHVPLHIGITEAGTAFQGIIKSAAGLSILLHEGIGDTLRISLTDDPVREVQACWTLLSALDIRQHGIEIVSCPTCGRCQVDLIELAREVEERANALFAKISSESARAHESKKLCNSTKQRTTAPLERMENSDTQKESASSPPSATNTTTQKNCNTPPPPRHISVAVMGCVVNGPGEARDADIGIACGAGSGILFAHGKKIRKVPEAGIVDALMNEIEGMLES